MRTAALAALLILALPGLAAADIPPPEGYVETCVVSAYAREGTRCASCDTWHSDERPCAQREELSGMTVCCRTAGASVWSEVWCEGACPAPNAPAPASPPAAPSTPASSPSAPSAPSAPPATSSGSSDDEDSGGCAVGRRGAAPGLAVLAVVAVAAWRRRRA